MEGEGDREGEQQQPHRSTMAVINRPEEDEDDHDQNIHQAPFFYYLLKLQKNHLFHPLAFFLILIETHLV